MICPVCRRAMIVIEFKRIELDFCPACHGTWFDQGELALLLESESGSGAARFIEGILDHPHAAGMGNFERKRRCPLCGRKMIKARVGGKDGVLLDACAQGEGIWFDGGEVDRLVALLDGKTGQPGQHDHVFQFMREVFGASDGQNP